MATLTYGNRLNLFNVHQVKSDRGETLNMAQNLAERNDLIRDLPTYKANQGLTHKIFRWTTLPSGERVQIGGTWGAEAPQGENAVEGMFSLKTSYEPKTDTLTDDDPEAASARVDGDIAAFEEGLSQSWANLLLKGDPAPRQDSIVGLMQRGPYNAIDNEFCFNVGGSAVSANTNLRSAWLMCPGINTVHLIHNGAHPTVGVERKRMPIQRVEDPDNVGTKHSYISPVEFAFQQGICIRDQRAVKRLANIPAAYGDTLTGDWFEALMYARYNHSIIGQMDTMAGNKGSQWFLYVDGWTYAKLVTAANNEKGVYFSSDNIYVTKLMMIGDIIVRRLDALSLDAASGETYVS